MYIIQASAKPREEKPLKEANAESLVEALAVPGLHVKRWINNKAARSKR